MNKIDEIALRVAEQIEQRGRTYSPDHYVDVVKLVLAELSKDAVPACFQYQDREGNWKPFIDEHHQRLTIESGAWNIRKLFTNPANTEEIERRITELETINAKLKLEAQIHAQEARTANSTIAEIYQFITGSTGEPGNWNGAVPVKEKFAEIEQRTAEACAKMIDGMPAEWQHEEQEQDKCAEAIRSGKWREYL